MPRAAYEIRTVETVPASVLDDFEGVTVTTAVGGSTIRADFADEACLHGVLAALRRGGYTLVDLQRDDQDDAWEPPPGGRAKGSRAPH